MNPTITESLPVLSLVVVGYLLKKVKVLKDEDGAVFSRLIIYITLPCLIFLSIYQAKLEPGELGILALSSFLIVMVLRFAAGGLTKLLKLDKSVAGVVILCAMVMNIGSLMYPLVQTVYGVDGLSRTAAFDIGNSMLASGYGYYLATRYGSKNPLGVRASVKKVLSIPVFWAILLGLTLNLANFQIPAFILKMLTPLSQANTPLALLALGIFVKFEFSQWKLIGATVFLRMGLGFLVGQTVVWLLHLQGLDRAVVTIASIMPIGLVPMAYAATEGLDTKLAAACISLSILIGLIITPLFLSFSY